MDSGAAERGPPVSTRQSLAPDTESSEKDRKTKQPVCGFVGSPRPGFIVIKRASDHSSPFPQPYIILISTESTEGREKREGRGERGGEDPDKPGWPRSVLRRRAGTMSGFPAISRGCRSPGTGSKSPKRSRPGRPPPGPQGERRNQSGSSPPERNRCETGNALRAIISSGGVIFFFFFLIAPFFSRLRVCLSHPAVKP